MDTEIELKFLVTSEVSQQLPNLLQPYRIRQYDQKKLANTYFDTANLALSSIKAGLRIRRQGDLLEQTVKLAGSQIGGLHQRPEYNVPITVEQPDLALFAAHIWPTGFDISATQAALQPLFSTDFLRTRWVIDICDTQIELALDNGEVRAGSQCIPIREVELELVHGQVSDLFVLAEQLVKAGGWRLCAVSKAQRGYRLAELSPVSTPQPLTLRTPLAQANTPALLLQSVQQGIAHWQHHEEGGLAAPTLDEAWLSPWREGVSLVLNTLQQGADQRLIEINKHRLDDLLWLQQQLAKLTDHTQLTALCYSPRYSGLMLEITHWLFKQ